MWEEIGLVRGGMHRLRTLAIQGGVELQMMEEDGSGAIVEDWITTATIYDGQLYDLSATVENRDDDDVLRLFKELDGVQTEIASIVVPHGADGADGAQGEVGPFYNLSATVENRDDDNVLRLFKTLDGTQTQIATIIIPHGQAGTDAPLLDITAVTEEQAGSTLVTLNKEVDGQVDIMTQFEIPYGKSLLSVGFYSLSVIELDGSPKTIRIMAQWYCKSAPDGDFLPSGEPFSLGDVILPAGPPTALAIEQDGVTVSLKKDINDGYGLTLVGDWLAADKAIKEIVLSSQPQTASEPQTISLSTLTIDGNTNQQTVEIPTLPYRLFGNDTSLDLQVYSNSQWVLASTVPWVYFSDYYKIRVGEDSYIYQSLYHRGIIINEEQIGFIPQGDEYKLTFGEDKTLLYLNKNGLESSTVRRDMLGSTLRHRGTFELWQDEANGPIYKEVLNRQEYLANIEAVSDSEPVSQSLKQLVIVDAVEQSKKYLVLRGSQSGVVWHDLARVDITECCQGGDGGLLDNIIEALIAELLSEAISTALKSKLGSKVGESILKGAIAGGSFSKGGQAIALALGLSGATKVALVGGAIVLSVLGIAGLQEDEVPLFQIPASSINQITADASGRNYSADDMKKIVAASHYAAICWVAGRRDGRLLVMPPTTIWESLTVAGKAALYAWSNLYLNLIEPVQSWASYVFYAASNIFDSMSFFCTAANNADELFDWTIERVQSAYALIGEGTISDLDDYPSVIASMAAESMMSAKSKGFNMAQCYDNLLSFAEISGLEPLFECGPPEMGLGYQDFRLGMGVWEVVLRGGVNPIGYFEAGIGVRANTVFKNSVRIATPIATRTRITNVKVDVRNFVAENIYAAVKIRGNYGGEGDWLFFNQSPYSGVVEWAGDRSIYANGWLSAEIYWSLNAWIESITVEYEEY